MRYSCNAIETYCAEQFHCKTHWQHRIAEAESRVLLACCQGTTRRQGRRSAAQGVPSGSIAPATLRPSALRMLNVATAFTCAAGTAGSTARVRVRASGRRQTCTACRPLRSETLPSWHPRSWESPSPGSRPCQPGHATPDGAGWQAGPGVHSVHTAAQRAQHAPTVSSASTLIPRPRSSASSAGGSGRMARPHPTTSSAAGGGRRAVWEGGSAARRRGQPGSAHNLGAAPSPLISSDGTVAAGRHWREAPTHPIPQGWRAGGLGPGSRRVESRD